MQKGAHYSEAHILRRLNAQNEPDYALSVLLVKRGDQQVCADYDGIFFSNYRDFLFSLPASRVRGSRARGQHHWGPGIIVEVDETKLGKRKYNRGHRVEGVWVVVGVERTVERRVFIVQIEKRDAQTLTDVISRHVANGSIVYTDLWRGYATLEDRTGLRHLSVNHSGEFVESATGVHTNTVEGTNFAIKRQISIRCRVRGGIEGHLAEFIWRRRNINRLWDAFISALKEVHYDV